MRRRPQNTEPPDFSKQCQGIGERLRGIRVCLGLKQEDLGREMAAMGVLCNRVTIAKMEADQRPLKLAEALVYARLAGITVEDLVGLNPLGLVVAV